MLLPIEEEDTRLMSVIDMPTRHMSVVWTDTVKLALVPKPDDFPNPTLGQSDLWFMFAWCMVLAFVYFTVMLYMLLPDN